MTTQRVIAYVFLLVLVSLIISALVSLQLFQDGSSYLFELLVTNSAIRHHRLSVYLIQMPPIVMNMVLARLETGSDINLQIVRLTFSLSYSLIPLISLILSWLVIRRKYEGLFIWAALIILFVNLVNFSWVSELLIALQLSCPLLLASLLRPGTKLYWALMVLLLPTILFLHPLVLLLFVALAVGSAYVSYEKVELRKAAQLSAAIFLAAAILRGLLSFYMLTSYETSFLGSGEMNEYLFVTSLENKLFLVISLLIALLCLLAKSVTTSGRRNRTFILLLIVPIQALALLLFLINLNFLSGFYKFLILGILITLAVGSQYRYFADKSPDHNLKFLYTSCINLVVIAGLLLLSQYFSGAGNFPLKTGLAFFASLLIMGMASLDSLRKVSPREEAQRFRVVIALSVIFASVIISKSLIWRSSVQKLEQSLSMSNSSCIEVGSEEFTWLPRNPYNIINNWSLPTLALVMQNVHPRKLLLEEKSCQLFHEADIVRIDPWTDLPKSSIVPPLN